MLAATVSAAAFLPRSAVSPEAYPVPFNPFRLPANGSEHTAKTSAVANAGGSSMANGGCIAINFNFTEVGLSCEDVTFHSNGANSGTTTMYGSIVKPLVAVAAPRPGAVLVAGSGPNNRWEDFVPLLGTRTFLDVSVAIATRGITVLVYDKRSCSAAPYCTNRKFCTAVALGDLPPCGPDCVGCVNLYEVSLWDFATDAAAALSYLQGKADVDAGQLALIGHSQGCTIAPLAAKYGNAANVGLLEGDGASLGTVLSAQSAFQLPAVQAQLVQAKALGCPVVRGVASCQDLEGSINASKCTIAHAPAQMALIASGELAGFSNEKLKLPAFAVPMGGYVSQAVYASLLEAYGKVNLDLLGIHANTSYCPAAEINGEGDDPCLCSEPLVLKTSCNLKCQRAELVGAGSPSSYGVPFALSWLKVGNMSARQEAWKALQPLKPRILATNGWSDGNVPPTLFVPEHDVVTHRASRPIYPPGVGIASAGAAEFTSHTFANITHEMIDVVQKPCHEPPCTYPMREDVLNAITTWLCRGVTCAPSLAAPSTASPTPLTLGTSPDASTGSSCGAPPSPPAPTLSPLEFYCTLAALGGAMVAWAISAALHARRERTKAAQDGMLNLAAPLRMP